VSGPLEGVRVLELSQIIAAPFCGLLLADMGADVIKVEPVGGEPWRIFAQFLPGESKTYIALNRGKRSLPLDITNPEAQAIIHKMIPEIDVVLLNFRPDVPARCNIDYATLSAINQRLIYCENTAFGREGPDSYRPGYDIIIQAMSGLMAADNKTLNGVPQVVSATAIADYTTGVTMAWGITAALLAREKTGRGQRVEASLLATSLAVQSSSTTFIDALDSAWQPKFLADLQAARDRGATWEEVAALHIAARPTQTVGNIYYRTYKTKDSYMAVGCLSNSLRLKLLGVLGLKDQRFEDPAWNPATESAKAAGEQLIAEAEALFQTRTTAEWLKLLDTAGVPSGPVRFAEELADDPQVKANGMTVEIEHELAGHMRTFGPTLKMSDTPLSASKPSPVLGAHTDEILHGLGFDATAIAGLRANGVVQ
jgi:formyl-CoA transferase